MSRRAALVAYVAVGVIWGLTFLFMHVALSVVSPAQAALLRVVFGAVPIAAFALAGGHVHVRHVRHVHHFLVMSVLAASFYYVALAEGTQLLDTGVAGALVGSIPLFATVGAAVLLPDERLTGGRVLGLVAGIAGVVLIAEPWEAGFVDPTGVAWMLVGCLSVGLSFPYARRYVTPLGIHPAAVTAYQLVLATAILAVITDPRGLADLADHPGVLAATILGLGLVCTGCAYVLYYLIVAALGASTASTASYLPPGIAMLVGVFALGETFRPLGAAGLALIVAGAYAAHRFGAVSPSVPGDSTPETPGPAGT